MGLSNSFMSLGGIAGPIWAGFVFDANVNYPYFSGSVIMFIGFLISLVWVSQGGKETTSADLQPAADCETSEVEREEHLWQIGSGT